MKLLVLVNALNVIDAIQTYMCVNRCDYCVEWNRLLYDPAMYYIKILVVWAWTLVLYRASMSKNELIAKTARAMLILLAFIFSIAVINNTMVLMNARC
jgi:hypothetical protein